MKVQNIGSRGFLFTFPDFTPFPQVPMPIQIYVINGENFIFICDTGVKREQIDLLKEYLTDKNLLSKPIIVFNSHFHMDHIGGNGVFESAKIISHKLCWEKMVKMLQRIKEKNEARLDDKSIAYPIITFQEKIIFPEDNIEFFYSPGHSEDSASCYDLKDKILYVGDNLVDPIPYLTWYGFDHYLTTLQNYCSLKPKTIVLGHKSVFDDISFINESIKYIEKFQNFNVDISSFTPQHAAWFRWSFLDLGLDLKEQGKYDEAQKYFKYINDLVRKPKVKPIDDAELKEIEEFLGKEIG